MERVIKRCSSRFSVRPTIVQYLFNDIFFFLDNTEASNYAGDTDLETLLYRLEHDAHISIEWFESNYMKLNEDKKCHFLISGNKSEYLFVNVGQYKIWESNAVKILGITVDASLKFNIHSVSILNIDYSG